MIKYIPINNINTKKYPNKFMNNNEAYKKAIEKVIIKAEQDIDDKSYYLPIEEFLQNFETDANTKSIKLKIAQDEENFSKHFLEVVISNPNSQIDITRPITYGNKDDILRFLKNPESLKLITEHIKQMG